MDSVLEPIPHLAVRLDEELLQHLRRVDLLQSSRLVLLRVACGSENEIHCDVCLPPFVFLVSVLTVPELPDPPLLCLVVLFWVVTNIGTVLVSDPLPIWPCLPCVHHCFNIFPAQALFPSLTFTSSSSPMCFTLTEWRSHARSLSPV